MQMYIIVILAEAEAGCPLDGTGKCRFSGKRETKKDQLNYIY